MARRRTQAERLFATAKIAAKCMESDKGLGKLAALHHALINCFEAEDAEAIYQALALAEQAQERSAAALIETVLEYISTHQYAEDRQSVNVISLIAIPVFMEIPAPFALDTPDMQRNAAFADLEQSFRKMGLVKNSASVVLHNYLYHPYELGRLSYFDVAAVTVNLQASLLEGVTVSAEQLGQTRAAYEMTFSDNPPRIELRYLLGMMQDNASDLSFEFSDRGGRPYVLFEKRLADWKELVLQLLPECLDFNGVMKMDVLKPQLFYEAYRQGLKALLNSELYYNMVSDLEQMDVLPEAARALIAPCTKDKASKCIVFVYRQEKDQLLLVRGRSVLPFENAKEARVDLALILKAVGVEEVIILEEQQDRCAASLQPAGHDVAQTDKSSALITLTGNDTVH